MQRYKQWLFLGSLAIFSLFTSCSSDVPGIHQGDQASLREVASAEMTFDLEGKLLPIENNTIYNDSRSRALKNGSHGGAVGDKKDNYTDGYTPSETSRVVIRVQEANDRYMLDDEGNRTSTHNQLAQIDRELTIKTYPEIEALLIVRAQSTKNPEYVSKYNATLHYTYYAAKWKYDTSRKTYRLYATFNVAYYTDTGSGYNEINDIVSGDKPLEAMVIVGGNKFDPTTKTLTLGFNKIIDLNNPTTHLLPVPYVSEWTKVYRHNGVFSSLSPIKLKPYGSLITMTFRNNRKEDVVFPTLNFSSNQLRYLVTLDLTRDAFNGSNLVEGLSASNSQGFTALANQLGSHEFSTFYTSTRNLRGGDPNPGNNGLTVKTGGELSNFVVVTWGLPVALNSSAAWSQSVNEQTAPQVGYPQMHVYAENVKNASTNEDITTPNYTITPIMGTDKTFKNGSSYTLNCEFYTPPRQQLEDLSSSDFSAANYYSYPQPATGSSLSSDEAWANLLSFAYPIPFSGSASQVNNYVSSSSLLGLHTLASGVQQQTFPIPATTGGKTAATVSTFDALTIVPTISKDKVNYAIRLAYRRPNVAGTSIRSPYQSYLIYRATGTDATMSKLSKLEVRSIYLGKYYVGNPYETPAVMHHENRSWLTTRENFGGYTGLESIFKEDRYRSASIERSF